MVFIQDVAFQDFGSQNDIASQKWGATKMRTGRPEPEARKASRDLFVSYRVTKLGLPGMEPAGPESGHPADCAHGPGVRDWS
jgi:hypothetical protein